MILEDLVSKKVSVIADQCENTITSLCLSVNQRTLFIGSKEGVLTQFNLERKQKIGVSEQLNIGKIYGLDQNSNLLLVGGVNNFALFKIPKNRSHSNFYINTYESNIYLLKPIRSLRHYSIRISSVCILYLSVLAWTISFQAFKIK